jgi:hypothetical protein
MPRISVSGLDNGGLTVTLYSDKSVEESNSEEIAKETAKLLKHAFYIGLKDKLDPDQPRGLDRQFVTHFILRNKGGELEADLFTRYSNMKIVTVYLSNDGMEELFRKKAGIDSLDKYQVYQGKAFDKSEDGDTHECFHKLPKSFPVTIKPNGVYKDGKAKGKQKMKAIL